MHAFTHAHTFVTHMQSQMGQIDGVSEKRVLVLKVETHVTVTVCACINLGLFGQA